MLDLPDKLELNGADYFHLLLERINRSNPTSNNVVRMLISIENESKLQEIVDRIESSEVVKWIANLELKKPVFSRAHWSLGNNSYEIKVKRHDSITWQNIFSIPITLNSDHLIRFDTIKTDGKIKLLFSWHHILMDGRGAGLLMQYLSENTKKEIVKPSLLYQHPQNKTSFLSKFRRMFDVKHFVEDMLKESMQSPTVKNNDSSGFHHLVVALNNEETNAIEVNAKASGSKFGSNIFQLACCFSTISEISNNDKKIWVPVPYDGRKRGSRGPIIGNHISFLFYKISPEENDSIESIVQSLNQQMSDQIKREIPVKYNDMLTVMRDFPIQFYQWATTRSGKGRVSSFLYSSSGEGVWDTNRLNKSFKDILLIPPFSNDPGITFTFSRFNNQLKINIIACKKKFDEKEVSLIKETLMSKLLVSKNAKRT
ncbi:MAG: condensation domain-containing protein [Brumimicrobium sp.]